MSELEGLSIEEIARRIEQDIRDQAETWRWKAKQRTAKGISSRATATAALYLQKHKDLYMRSTAEETRQMHQYWMDLMREWFISTAS